MNQTGAGRDAAEDFEAVADGGAGGDDHLLRLALDDLEAALAPAAGNEGRGGDNGLGGSLLLGRLLEEADAGCHVGHQACNRRVELDADNAGRLCSVHLGRKADNLASEAGIGAAVEDDLGGHVERELPEPRLRHIGFDEQGVGVDELDERRARCRHSSGRYGPRGNNAGEGGGDDKLAEAGAERLDLCVGGLHIGLRGNDAGIEHGQFAAQVVEVCGERDAGGNQPLLPLEQAGRVGPLRFCDFHSALRCCAAGLGGGDRGLGILGVEFEETRALCDPVALCDERLDDGGGHLGANLRGHLGHEVARRSQRDEAVGRGVDADRGSLHLEDIHLGAEGADTGIERSADDDGTDRPAQPTRHAARRGRRRGAVNAESVEARGERF